ncbi:MAG: hypothetical protein J6C13_02945 [Clostridia bacterium]|nr:hypothetical protein [Clostridia bacterium]
MFTFLVFAVILLLDKVANVKLYLGLKSTSWVYFLRGFFCWLRSGSL